MNKTESIKRMKHYLLFIVLSIMCTNCNLSDSSSDLKKITQAELIKLYEDFNIPNASELTFRNINGDSIHQDSLKNMFIPGQHYYDYYKDSNGKIVECRIRMFTEEDEAFLKELNRTKVKLSQDEIDEIKKLETPAQKSEYLHSLWQADQNLRQGQGAEITVKYGKQSDQYKSHLKKSIEANGRIFIKIKTYLELHGYPQEPELYHELALNAFPTIIGHNHNYDEQHELIQHLYKSYKQGYCKVGELIWIMGEMHESKHNGRRYEMKSNRYTGIDEFNELNQVLNLGFEFRF